MHMITGVWSTGNTRSIHGRRLDGLCAIANATSADPSTGAAHAQTAARSFCPSCIT